GVDIHRAIRLRFDVDAADLAPENLSPVRNTFARRKLARRDAHKPALARVQIHPMASAAGEEDSARSASARTCEGEAPKRHLKFRLKCDRSPKPASNAMALTVKCA